MPSWKSEKRIPEWGDIQRRPVVSGEARRVGNNVCSVPSAISFGVSYAPRAQKYLIGLKASPVTI